MTTNQRWPIEPWTLGHSSLTTRPDDSNYFRTPVLANQAEDGAMMPLHAFGRTAAESIDVGQRAAACVSACKGLPQLWIEDQLRVSGPGCITKLIRLAATDGTETAKKIGVEVNNAISVRNDLLAAAKEVVDRKHWIMQAMSAGKAAAMEEILDRLAAAVGSAGGATCG